ncbi:MAG TPA: M14 family zinc carboxypeptidase [Cyclobacteriaceae bacterium]|nr:M14 family zinc carboxypeptidase [Cyclobacteriaceae bacterium]
MKQFSLIIGFWLAFFISLAQNNYFFPQGNNFDPAIPTPEQFLGYPIGDWHTRHDRIVNYFEELAKVSPKAHFQIIGYTNEHRAQVVLTITSPENYARIDEVQKEHVRLTDPSQTVSTSGMPVIVTLGYNVHGNEPSSSEAAMLTAYYLIARQGAEADQTLRESVIHIDPNYNPDGRDRHSTWANMHKGSPPVADPLDREHNEGWPRGRFNHYWFDLNRDWLPLAHVESQNRLEFFHKWLPNVCTDFHEMGTNGTNFFEPTKPYGSENPVVPRDNYDKLNPLFEKYFVKALDEIGSLYWAKEVFDNSYPGYGSTYPDIHGGLGLVFEQASSRGHVQQSSTRVITFPFTIRNHVRTGLATVKASIENRELLLKHQQDYFKSAIEEGRKSAIKAYVFGDNSDKGRTNAFVELLLKHRIETYALDADITVGGTRYEKGKAFIVPTDQRQYRMVRTMFEKVTKFYDSVFYDASSWTMALGYGIPHEGLTASVKFSRGEKIKFEDIAPKPTPVPKSNYAYVFEWNEYYAPKALYHLLDNGVFAKAAFKPFTAVVNGQNKNFGYGTIVVAVADQNLPADEVYTHIKEASRKSGIDIYNVETGMTSQGVYLGSGNIRTVEKPKVIMLIGNGASPTEAGAIWHLLDTKVEMPITKVDTDQFSRVNLFDYNTLILVSGNYGMLGDKGVEKIKDWVKEGGTLILQRYAVNWAINSKLIDEQLVKENGDKSSSLRLDYVTADDHNGSREIGGSMYMADLDITHPLGFGYARRGLPVYRNHDVFIQPSKSPFNTVVKYTSNPLLSGYVHPSNLNKIRNSVSLEVTGVGRGRAILFVDDPNFRGYWYGTNKLFFNALFFGSHIAAPNFNGQ